MRVKVSKVRDRRLALYRLFTFYHANPNGGILLKGEANWRNINGFLINTKKGAWDLIFRRHFNG